MEFENRATGVFITSTGDVRGSNRLEIQMDKAKLVVENNQLMLEEFEMSAQEFNAINTIPYGRIGYTVSEVETDGENPQHPGVLDAWAAAMLGKGELVAKGTEGIRGLTLANAMYLSAFLGKEVTLPIDEELYYQELMKRVATSRRKETPSVFVNDRSSYGFGSH
jgi:predicted dehydrogenase